MHAFAVPLRFVRVDALRRARHEPRMPEEWESGENPRTVNRAWPHRPASPGSCVESSPNAISYKEHQILAVQWVFLRFLFFSWCQTDVSRLFRNTPAPRLPPDPRPPKVLSWYL
jgi:hypothetical protein